MDLQHINALILWFKNNTAKQKPIIKIYLAQNEVILEKIGRPVFRPSEKFTRQTQTIL